MTRPPATLSTCGSCRSEVLAALTGERPTPMEHVSGCPLENDRACDWCTGPMVDMAATAEVCSTACRAARWKAANNYGKRPMRRANGRQKPSGAQLSYAKAITALAAFLAEEAMPSPELLARDILAEALPARQRARLEGRDR